MKFHCIVSFDLSDYKSLYIGADACFHKKWSLQIICFVIWEMIVLFQPKYKGTTRSCQLRGFAWMIITSEDFLNKPFKVNLKNEKRERFYNTAPSFGSLRWWTVERECYFPLSFEMPLGRQATPQCAKKKTSRVLRAPFFFSVRKSSTVGHNWITF